MGQKVHPLALRLGYTKNWRSLWFAQRREYSDNIKQDFKIRAYIREKFEQAAVSMIVIERLAEQVKVRIHTARPGIISGGMIPKVVSAFNTLDGGVGKIHPIRRKRNAPPRPGRRKTLNQVGSRRKIVGNEESRQ